MSELTELLKRDHVTFAEIVQEVSYAKGNMELGWPEKNIVLWAGLSEQIVKEIEALIDSGAVEYKGTSALPYFIDGLVPLLPQAKSNRRYKTVRWLPVCFKLKKAAL